MSHYIKRRKHKNKHTGTHNIIKLKLEAAACLQRGKRGELEGGGNITLI